MQNVYASKELNEFLIEITTKWTWLPWSNHPTWRWELNCCVEPKSWRKTQRSRCENNAQHKPSIRQQISRTRREWCQNCERESSHVDMFCTWVRRCVTVGKSPLSLWWCVRFAALGFVSWTVSTNTSQKRQKKFLLKALNLSVQGNLQWRLSNDQSLLWHCLLLLFLCVKGSGWTLIQNHSTRLFCSVKFHDQFTATWFCNSSRRWSSKFDGSSQWTVDAWRTFLAKRMRRTKEKVSILLES